MKRSTDTDLRSRVFGSPVVVHKVEGAHLGAMGATIVDVHELDGQFYVLKSGNGWYDLFVPGTEEQDEKS